MKPSSSFAQFLMSCVSITQNCFHVFAEKQSPNNFVKSVAHLNNEKVRENGSES